MTPENCDHCGNEIPFDCRHCPHCCHGLRCPNTRKANEITEKKALNARYQAAVDDAVQRGAGSVLREFEVEVGTAKAVMGTTLNKLLPIANRSRDLFATYYDLMDLNFFSEHTGSIDWNTRRPQAEIELMGTHKHIESLHYACLSIDGESLPHYGEFNVWLAEKMIAHRASLLSENSAMAYDRDKGFELGHRAIWDDRVKLSVAKLASRLTSSLRSSQFPRILMKAGVTAIDDEFLEVQVLGEITIRTFECVTIKARKSAKRSSEKRPRSRRGSKDEVLIRDYCLQNGVPCELI